MDGNNEPSHVLPNNSETYWETGEAVGFVDGTCDATMLNDFDASANGFRGATGSATDVIEWDLDRDCEPDTYYEASTADELETKLQAALDSILNRVSSGGAASVITASSSGEGAVFQAVFQPFEE